MTKHITLIATFLLTFISLSAQESKQTICPILLDKSVLSGVGLDKIDLKNEPEKDFYQKNLYRGRDIAVYVVSTENWTNKIEKYPFDEFVYMYQGEAVVKPTIGTAQVFYSGEYFFAPKGFTGEWEIRGGINLHYELSVISRGRADTTLIGENPQHKLFDRSVLSGNSISLNEEGHYETILQEGLELTIKLKAESPIERPLNPAAPEQMIHILAGQIKITDSEGQEQQFYSGDFIVFPQGCSGTWKSEGHQLIKYMTIEKTK